MTAQTFKKTISFYVTEQEELLMKQIMDKGWKRIAVLRRGIVSSCNELGIDVNNNEIA